MARSLSSRKRLRQTVVRTAQNKARRSELKTSVRKVQDTILKRDVAASEAAFREACGLLDRNGNRKTIHKNAAARRKRRLARRLNELKAAAKS